MGLIPGQGGYLSIIDAFITSGKISNANIAECSDSYRHKGYTALVSQHSTQNLNLMPADGKYKFIKQANNYKAQKYKYKTQKLQIQSKKIQIQLKQITNTKEKK